MAPPSGISAMDGLINRPWVNHASPEVQCTLLKLSLCFRVFLCVYFLGAALTDSGLAVFLLAPLKTYFAEHSDVNDDDGKHQTVAAVLVFMVIIFILCCVLFIVLSQKTTHDIRNFRHTQSRTLGLLPPPMPMEPDPESAPENQPLHSSAGPRFSVLADIKFPALIGIVALISILYGIGTMTLLLSAQWTTSFDNRAHKSSSSQYYYSDDDNKDDDLAALARKSDGIFYFALTMLATPAILFLCWIIFYLPLAYHVVKSYKWQQDEQRALYQERVLAAEAWCRMRDLSHQDDVQRWEERQGSLPPAYSETPPSTAAREIPL